MLRFNEVIIDAQSKIMTANEALSAMSGKVDELEKECMRLKDWEVENKNIPGLR